MEFNVYGRQLTAVEIEQGKHRELVGGLWDELGALQFEFLKARGLKPTDRLLDVGCGAMRGGVHFVAYLDAGNYHGIDINRSLIDAGKIELEQLGLQDKHPNLLVSDNFEVGRFGTRFDWAFAVSVFTHLPMNSIIRCLVEVGKTLRPGGRFLASYFEAPRAAHLSRLHHTPGGIVSNFDDDPFHYAFAELEWMASQAGLRAERIGSWQHPRDQQMAAFTAAD